MAFADAFFHFSFGISVPGLMLSITSFIFCIKQASRTVTQTLYTFLNIIDIIFLTMMLVTGYMNFDEKLEMWDPPIQAALISYCSYAESALITTTLTISRAIVISDPFRHIGIRGVLTGLILQNILFVLPLIVTIIATHNRDGISANDYPEHVSNSILIFLVVTSTVAVAVIAKSLLTSEVPVNNAVRSRNFRVTLTILSITFVFIVSNTTSVVAYFIQRYVYEFGGPKWELYFVIRALSLLLNAALNPLMYLIFINRVKINYCKGYEK